MNNRITVCLFSELNINSIKKLIVGIYAMCRIIKRLICVKIEADGIHGVELTIC